MTGTSKTFILTCVVIFTCLILVYVGTLDILNHLVNLPLFLQLAVGIYPETLAGSQEIRNAIMTSSLFLAGNLN